eukprot:Anaeramoba_ignava/c21171_g2_i1.p3 GENE.c21171_g2_i1~~c21171_g2_i1.p3  ORF type:complete len:103 (-),score=19.56 c21171_g2_i1:3172-3480(-)
MVELYFAIISGSFERIKEHLTNQNVNYRFKPDNNTPLHFACQKNIKVDIIKYFLDFGADLHAMNLNNDTPLHFACENSQSLQIVELLIHRGAKINVPNVFKN